MNTHKRDPFYKPNTVQFELVQGCNRRCKFCGTLGFKHKVDCISPKVLKKQCDLVRDSGYNPRILIAGHGENTLHPDFYACIKMMRKRMPKQHIQILTNGYLVKRSLSAIPKMFDAGINDICLDEYSDSKFDSEAIQRILTQYESRRGCKVEFVRMGKGVSLYAPKNPKSKRLMIIPALDESEIAISRKVTNHCGAGNPPTTELSHRVCTRIFRELSFRWDGNVALCCQDFRGQYFISNVMDATTFDDIWLHPRFEAARKILYHKKRIFFPCNVCDHLPIREGLLPDHLGKQTMPKPSKKDLAVVSKVYPPLTEIVKREWE